MPKCFLFIALEKRDVSTANILHSKVTPSGKSFIYIFETILASKHSCGISAKMFFHENVCPFKMTCCCQSFTCLSNFSKLPSMPYVCSFKIKPLCLTFSKTFEMSANVPLTSTGGFVMPCVIDSSCDPHELLGKKPDW